MKKKKKQNSEKGMKTQKGIVAVALALAMGLSALPRGLCFCGWCIVF